MIQNEQDLLVCAFGSTEVAKDLSQQFENRFPRIHVHHTPGFMETLFLLSGNRFHVVVLVIVGDFESASRGMITKLCDLKYSKNAIFAYFADRPSLVGNHFPVDSFPKGKIEELMAAAKKAASLKQGVYWASRDEIKRAEEAARNGDKALREWKKNHPPLHKPWWKKLLGK